MPSEQARQCMRHNMIESHRGIHDREEKAQVQKPPGDCRSHAWWLNPPNLGFRCVQGHSRSTKAKDSKRFLVNCREQAITRFVFGGIVNAMAISRQTDESSLADPFVSGAEEKLLLS